MKIYDEEIKEWLDDCPTHKLEIQHLDENGIHVSVRFLNEPSEQEENDMISKDTNEVWSIDKAKWICLD